MTVTVTAVIVTMVVTAVVIRGRYEVRRLATTLAPEKLLELGHPNSLALFAGHVQAVLIDEHFGMLEPLAPSSFRHGVEDLLAELALEWRLLETFGFFTQLDALNGSRHARTILSCSARSSTGISLLQVRLLHGEPDRHTFAKNATTDLGHLPAAS